MLSSSVNTAKAWPEATVKSYATMRPSTLDSFFVNILGLIYVSVKVKVRVFLVSCSQALFARSFAARPPKSNFSVSQANQADARSFLDAL